MAHRMIDSMNLTVNNNTNNGTVFQPGSAQVNVTVNHHAAELINDLDAALKFSIEVEEKTNMENVTNYDEVKAAIIDELMQLKNTPNRNERPLIFIRTSSDTYIHV